MYARGWNSGPTPRLQLRHVRRNPDDRGLRGTRRPQADALQDPRVRCTQANFSVAATASASTRPRRWVLPLSGAWQSVTVTPTRSTPEAAACGCAEDACRAPAPVAAGDAVRLTSAIELKRRIESSIKAVQPPTTAMPFPATDTLHCADVHRVIRPGMPAWPLS